MGKTSIEYCDEVSNPLQAKDLETGKMGTHCEKPDPEGTCKGCWAETLNMRGNADNQRFGTGLAYSKENRDRIEWRPHYKEMERLASLNRRKPMSVKFPGNPLVVFTNDTYDLFQPSISDELRDWVFDNYDKFSDLNLLIQSTYVSLMGKYLRSRYPDGMPSQYIVGMSAGNQSFFDANAEHLLSVPARRRYVIFEPLLGEIRAFQTNREAHEEAAGIGLDDSFFVVSGIDPNALHNPGIHWIIVGGESGVNARPMPFWTPRTLRDQCNAAGVAFLFKQWGEWVSEMHDEAKPFKQLTSDAFVTLIDGGSDYEGLYMCRVGKKKAGRLLDGREWNEFPKQATAVMSSNDSTIQSY